MGYSHDSEFPFAAFITNLGKYNEGELVGEWVKFPTTPEKLQEVFERIGIGSADDFGNPYEEWFITDYVQCSASLCPVPARSRTDHIPCIAGRWCGG